MVKIFTQSNNTTDYNLKIVILPLKDTKIYSYPLKKDCSDVKEKDEL